jgi:hypothetical protein
MGFFKNFLTASQSTALIDISSGSVAGGYLARTKEGQMLAYSVRIPVQTHSDEKVEDAVLRALSEVNDTMVREGAPALRRVAGSGSVGRVLVLISSPWQDTEVRIERIEQGKPFVFTRSLAHEVLKRTAAEKPDRISSGESIIATILNGYEVAKPFGKEVQLADLVVLSSSVGKDFAERVEQSVRRAFHTHRIALSAFAPVSYAVFRDTYPHEKDYLVIDVSGEATEIAFIKQGLIASVLSVPYGLHALLHAAEKSLPATTQTRQTAGGVHIIRHKEDDISGCTVCSKWIDEILSTLKSFSEEHPLPRTIFLLADPEARDYLKRVLDDPKLRGLWLTDEPLSIIPVAEPHFLEYVKIGPEAKADVQLMMLGVYEGKSIDELTA